MLMKTATKKVRTGRTTKANPVSGQWMGRYDGTQQAMKSRDGLKFDTTEHVQLTYPRKELLQNE
jgi:hypothetical protein